MLEKLENAALFLRLSAVHTNSTWNRSFSETLFKLEKIENARFPFSRGRKTFENEAFQNWYSHDNNLIFTAWVFFNLSVDGK